DDFSQPVVCRRLMREGKRAARQAMLAVFVHADDLYGDMAGLRALLQLAENSPAEHVGEADVERYGGRTIIAGQRQRIRAAAGHQHLEALVACSIPQQRSISGVIFDDQEDSIATTDLVAI